MKLVTTVSVPKNYLDEIHNSFPVLEVFHCNSEEEAQKNIVDADIVLSDHVSFGYESLEKASNLKWLQLLTAGVDKLPLHTLYQRGVTVTNTRGIHKIQMSEYALNVMLNFARKREYYSKLQKNHKWESGFIGDELYGKTVTILGSGSIGSEIAKKCRAIGMKVYGVNKSGNFNADFDFIFKQDRWAEALPESSFIILLLPITPSTKQFVRKEHFKQMRSDCFFINLSRGEIVNEMDLINALKSNQIGGAALDVFENEPLDENSVLWDLENVIITPHHGGASKNYMERAYRIIIENIDLFLKGEMLQNKINLKEEY